MDYPEKTNNQSQLEQHEEHIRKLHQKDDILRRLASENQKEIEKVQTTTTKDKPNINPTKAITQEQTQKHQQETSPKTTDNADKNIAYYTYNTQGKETQSKPATDNSSPKKYTTITEQSALEQQIKSFGYKKKNIANIAKKLQRIGKLIEDIPQSKILNHKDYLEKAKLSIIQNLDDEQDILHMQSIIGKDTHTPEVKLTPQIKNHIFLLEQLQTSTEVLENYYKHIDLDIRKAIIAASDILQAYDEIQHSVHYLITAFQGEMEPRLAEDLYSELKQISNILPLSQLENLNNKFHSDFLNERIAVYPNDISHIPNHPSTHKIPSITRPHPESLGTSLQIEASTDTITPIGIESSINTQDPAGKPIIVIDNNVPAEISHLTSKLQISESKAPQMTPHYLEIPKIHSPFSLTGTLSTITDLQSISNLSDFSHLSLPNENPTSVESIIESNKRIKKALTLSTLELLAHMEGQKQRTKSRGKTLQTFKIAQDLSYHTEKKHEQEQQKLLEEQFNATSTLSPSYSVVKKYINQEQQKGNLPDQIAQQVTEIEKTLLRHIQDLTDKTQKLADLETQGYFLIKPEKAEREKIAQSYTTLANKAENLMTNATAIDTRTKEIYTTFLQSKRQDIKHLIQTHPEIAKPIIEIIHRHYTEELSHSIHHNFINYREDYKESPHSPPNLPETVPPKRQEKEGFLAQYLEPLMKIADTYQSLKLSYQERFRRKVDEWQHIFQDHPQRHPQEYPLVQKPRAERAQDLIQQLGTQSPDQIPGWTQEIQTLYDEDTTLGHALACKIQAFLEWSIDNTQMTTHQTQILAHEARRRADLAHNTYNDLPGQLSQEEREAHLADIEAQFKTTLKGIKADYQATRTYRTSIENLYNQKEETFYYRRNTEGTTEYKDNNNDEQDSNPLEYEEINDNIADLLSSNIDYIIQKMQNEINRITKAPPSKLSSSLYSDSPSPN